MNRSFLSAALLALGALASAQRYRLVAIDAPGLSDGQAYGVNDAGQVVGSGVDADGQERAFLSGANGAAPARVQNNERSGQGAAINARGQAAVTFTMGSYGNDRAYFYDPVAGLRALSTAYSRATGINARGQVVGFSNLANGNQRAFITGDNGGTLRTLGTLGGNYSAANGVNASGQVVGLSTNASGTNRAFRSAADGGALTDLGTLSGDLYSMGNAINAAGRVVGTTWGGAAAGRAFISGTGSGALQDLGSLGGSYSAAYGIDAQDRVVGTSVTAAGDQRAFLWTATGGMVDLNSLLDESGAGWTLLAATALSDSGYIAGAGYRNGQYGAFLLQASPVPEPSALAALGVGALALLRRRRK